MKFLEKRYVQILIAIAVGITLGAVFYPTKHIEKRITTEYEKKIDKLEKIHIKSTQKLVEEFIKQDKEIKSYKEITQNKISSYQSEIRQLKSKMTEKTYKLIKPDGTIEERTFKQSETEEYTSFVKSVKEEFTRKINNIEQKWTSIHKKRVNELKTQYKQEYELKLEEYKKQYEETIIDVNPKKYTLEAGYTTERKVYLHTSYTLWGPVFVGGHTEGHTDGTGLSGGLGLGISF